MERSAQSASLAWWLYISHPVLARTNCKQGAAFSCLLTLQLSSYCFKVLMHQQNQSAGILWNNNMAQTLNTRLGWVFILVTKHADSNVDHGTDKKNRCMHMQLITAGPSRQAFIFPFVLSSATYNHAEVLACVRVCMYILRPVQAKLSRVCWLGMPCATTPDQEWDSFCSGPDLMSMRLRCAQCSVQRSGSMESYQN